MESELIAWLRRRLPAHPRLALPIGDDAGVVALAGGAQALLTVDVVTDGVDFHLSEIGPRRAGRKALAVNLSDMAAMAARPTAAVVGLVLPRRDGLQIAQEIYEGLLPLAEKYDVAIAGGDTNSWDGALVISITLLGEPTARGTLRRTGAQAGDQIVVTGDFGGSILGKHLDFQPRVAEALRLHEQYALHAGLDVSDGLALDLLRLAAESGCGACLEPSRVPIADAAGQLAAARPADGTALHHALADGEDFELLLAVPADEARRMLADQPLLIPLTAIGEFVSQPGLWQREAAGRMIPLEPTGYLHA